MKYEELVKKLQTALNEKGAHLTVDGDPGPKTKAALEKYQVSVGFQVYEPDDEPTPVPERPKVISDDYFGAPWIGANLDLLGRSETDSELNARYVPEWTLEGLPGYKTLVGNGHAWCSLRENADKRKVGVKGTNSAAASSWQKWGRECPFWFGASLPIQHKSGGHHICDFLYWIDELNGIAATLDGNKGNKFDVCRTDLSGSGDKVVPSPRWSNDLPDGRFVSMTEVLEKYPQLRVKGSSGSSTR